MAKINYVESYADLRFLYDEWALTFEGLDPSDIDQVVEFLQENSNLTENEIPEAYIISGYYMNELCRLSGSNAYPDDLTIISFLPYGDIVAMSIGARWMTDIIDNNADREGWHPFNNDEELEDQELIDELADEYEDDEDWGDNEWDEYKNDGWDIDEFDEDDMYDDDLWDEGHKQWDESYSKKIKESFRDNLLGKYGYIDLEVTKNNLDRYINEIEKKYDLTVEKVTRHSYSGWPVLKITGEVDVIKEYLWHDFFGNEGPIEYEYDYDFDEFVSDIRLIESTQAADVSVGEIYDYLKTKTLVKDATLEDILKDKETTAWEYAFQKASEKNNGYDEKEFLDVYSKALKTLKNKNVKKESNTSARSEKTEKLLEVLDIIQSIAKEPIELLHAEWFPADDSNLLNDEEICEGVISKPFHLGTFTLLMSLGFVIVNHYSDLVKFGNFNTPVGSSTRLYAPLYTKAAYFQISDFKLDRLSKKLKGELE